MTASLKRNVVANGLGQGWRALMSFAFIPLYIKFLGVEAYGLIGIFAMLQAWLVPLDVGMRPALGREMARFRAGAHDSQSIRDLLRSVEIIGAGIACAVGLGIWAASTWLASDWLRVEKLSLTTVARAFTVMGAVTALRFIEDIYVSCLAGLELQIEQNIVLGLTATVRGLGAVAVLAWITPTVEAFFIWQGLVSLMTVTLFAAIVYRALPRAPHRPRFSMAALHSVWHFAAGMMSITCFALLLTQVDKVLLSRLLTLKDYGYYALAGVVANSLYILSQPVTTAYYPRFTSLATLGNREALCDVYHQGAQLVSVFMGAAGVVLIVFHDEVMLLWTGDPILVQHVAWLTAVLVSGTLLNGLMFIPYQLMLAHGWTTLVIKVNAVAVAILVPAILWAVPHYGAAGAAWIWVTLNAGYICFSISLMHRRLLPGERGRWYCRDVAWPLTAATATALLFRQLIPGHLARLNELIWIAAISLCVLCAAAMAAPAVRHQIALQFSKALSPSLPRAA